MLRNFRPSSTGVVRVADWPPPIARVQGQVGVVKVHSYGAIALPARSAAFSETVYVVAGASVPTTVIWMVLVDENQVIGPVKVVPDGLLAVQTTELSCSGSSNIALKVGRSEMPSPTGPTLSG